MFTTRFILNPGPVTQEPQVLLRITYQRKHKYISCGVYVAEKSFNPAGTADKQNWIRKTDLRHALHNATLSAWATKTEDVRRRLIVSGQPFTVHDIKQRIEGSQVGECFLSFVRAAIARYKENLQERTAQPHQTTLAHLSRFMGVDTQTGTLDISRLTPEVIGNFEGYLLNLPASSTYSTAAKRRNNVSMNLQRLHQHITAYIHQHKLPSEIDPMRGKKLPRAKTDRTQLSPAEISALQTLVLPTATKGERSIKDARDLYLCSYYLHGLRAGDLIGARVSQLRREVSAPGTPAVYRFNTSAQKTDKTKSILVEPQILPLLLAYAEGKQPEDFLFPHLPARCKHLTPAGIAHKIKNRVCTVDKMLRDVARLAGIDKWLTMHTARHSFADALYEKTRDVRLVQTGLGHERISMTERYLSGFQQKIADRANSVYEVETPAPTETPLKQNAKRPE